MKEVLSDPVSREEVVSMARYLSIDLKTEQRLLWIAKQAVNAPLPFGWEERDDDGGQLFYENSKTGMKSRQHPLDAIFRVLVHSERRKLVRGLFSLHESPEEVEVHKDTH